MRRVRRLARLVVGRNKLRRRYDRIEGALLLAMSAAFLAAVVGALFLGAHVYQSQRAGMARLRPATAILTRSGPDIGIPSARQVLARWPGPGGREKSGTLTAVAAPGISGAAAGPRVPVWLNRLGQPVTPPPGQALMITDAALMAIAAGLGAAIGLLLPYRLCRLSLDRRRLAAWESAWALTGPRWTSRR
jgi:hypothetical protein